MWVGCIVGAIVAVIVGVIVFAAIVAVDIVVVCRISIEGDVLLVVVAVVPGVVINWSRSFGCWEGGSARIAMILLGVIIIVDVSPGDSSTVAKLLE